MDSRIIPPRAAVTTIMPALGGPSSTTFHSSGEKAAFDVIRSSFRIDAESATAQVHRRNARSRSSPAGAHRHQPSAPDLLRSARPARLAAEPGGLDLMRAHAADRAGLLPAGWTARVRLGAC